MVKNTVDDFWAKVDRAGENDCWPWKEGLWQNGYGRFKLNYKSIRAHRYALELVKGPPISVNLLALHECLDRRCCNPKHLYWGTHQDNMRDRRMNYKPAWNRKEIP